MLDPILVPLDGSLLAECVLPHVVALARAFEARVTLLRVLSQDHATESVQSVDPLNWQIGKAEARLYLERIQAQLQKAAVQTQTATTEGLAAECITGFTRSEGMNLIILSTHGASGLNKWGISSVVQKVVISAPTSVLIVRAHQPVDGGLTEQDYKRILVPLDGSWRAEYVLPMISRLGRFHAAEIHLAHVVRKPEMARHMPLSQDDRDLSQRIVARNQEEAAHYLEGLQLRLALEGLNVHTHLLTSENPAATLHEFVEQAQINLVPLTPHGHSGHIE